MSGRPDASLIELYLDGMLSETDRIAFEQRIAREPHLQEQIQVQGEIDSALGRLFQPPAAPPVHLPSRAASLRIPAEGGSRWVGLLTSRWSIAAALLLGLAGVFFILRGGGRGDSEYPELPWRSPEMVYRIEVQKGMKPMWKCETEKEFSDTFIDRLGEPLLLQAKLPAGLEAYGLSYSNTLSPRTVYLLGRSNGVPIIVLADRVEKDTRPRVSADSGLRVYRRQVSDIVLYEITPLDGPRFLEHFYKP